MAVKGPGDGGSDGMNPICKGRREAERRTQANGLTEGISDLIRAQSGHSSSAKEPGDGGLMGCRVKPHMEVRTGGRRRGSVGGMPKISERTYRSYARSTPNTPWLQVEGGALKC